MEIFSCILTLLLFTTTSALSLQPYQRPLPLREDLKVPGDNPLDYCEDPSENILSIDRADITPDEIKPGANVTIEIHGDLSSDIKTGSQVTFSVAIKVGAGKIPVLSETADLCDFVEGGCPVEEGETVLQKDITIPDEVPKATYLVRVDAADQDEERITCVEATVTF